MRWNRRQNLYTGTTLGLQGGFRGPPVALCGLPWPPVASRGRPWPPVVARGPPWYLVASNGLYLNFSTILRLPDYLPLLQEYPFGHPVIVIHQLFFSVHSPASFFNMFTCFPYYSFMYVYYIRMFTFADFLVVRRPWLESRTKG